MSPGPRRVETHLRRRRGAPPRFDPGVRRSLHVHPAVGPDLPRGLMPDLWGFGASGAAVASLPSARVEPRRAAATPALRWLWERLRRLLG